jgi:hypothetical protein
LSERRNTRLLGKITKISFSIIKIITEAGLKGKIKSSIFAVALIININQFLAQLRQ